MKFDIPGLVQTTLAAFVIGGGTMVLNAHRDNAIQDEKIEQIEHRQESLDYTLQKLDESVRTLDRNVAVLTERLEK